MSQLTNFINTANTPTSNAYTIRAYFGEYLQNAKTLSQIPTDVPLETLIALTTFNPTIINGSALQNYGQNSRDVSLSAQRRLNQTGNISKRIGSFRPSVVGNAIQRRTIGPNDRRINGILLGLNPRERLLSGLDPKTKKLLEDLQDLKRLRELQYKLEAIARKLENQINRFSAIYNAIVNAPDAIIASALTVLINTLDRLEQSYTAVKNLLLLTYRIIKNVSKAIWKALTKDIPKAIVRIRKGFDVLQKLLKLPEVPRRIKFPKLPKLPRLSWSRSDFHAKYRKALAALKSKNNTFYQKAYDMAIQQSGFEIVDPKKDKIQRGLTMARNSLREARAKFEVAQARRTAALNNERQKLINTIRSTTATTERERSRLVKQYEGQQKSALSKIYRATRLTDLASARKYLTPQELTTIVRSSTVNTRQENILSDLPLSSPIIGLGGGLVENPFGGVIVTGYKTPDGRTVYEDRRTLRSYVLQSPAERTRQLANRSIPTLRNTINETTAAAKTVKTAFITTAAVGASFNSKVIRAEFLNGVVSQASTTNNIANRLQADADQVILNSETGQQVPTQTTGAVDPNSLREYSHNPQTKTVTTTIRESTASRAVNRVTTYNRTIATQLGYREPLNVVPSGPNTVSINGSVFYEMTLSIQYKTGPSTEPATSSQPLQPPVAPSETQETVPSVPAPSMTQPTTGQLLREYPAGNRIYSALERNRPNIISRNDPNIKVIQERLNQVLGSSLETNTQIYGPATRAAVTQFQTKWNSSPNMPKLAVDGRVGKDTWSALFNSLASSLP